MPVVFVDAETRSAQDLKKVGAYVYAESPSTRVILWSILAPHWPRSLVFEDPDLWDLLHRLKQSGQLSWTKDDPLEIISWGAFDRLVAGVPAFPHLWTDLREMSLSYGAPAALGPAAAFWSGTELKDDGKHLIRRFCRPQKDGSWIGPKEDPIRWEQFRSYAGQDTMAMRPIWDRIQALDCRHDMADHEPGLGAVRRMNERGYPIDSRSVESALRVIEAAESQLVAECEKEWGFAPSQTEKVREALGTPDVQKGTLEAFLQTEEDLRLQRLAGIRLEVAGAARKKLGPMLATQCRDGRVRGGFTYHGAWTRRLTAQLVQPQNFVRAKSDEAFFEELQAERPLFEEGIFDAVRENIRGFVATPVRDQFVAADYNAIELRVAAWVANEDWLLKVLREGDDPYRIMAGRIYGVDPRLIAKHDPKRDFGKVVELGSGYQLGGDGLFNQCQAKGIDITLEAAHATIRTYRATHEAIVRCWAGCQEAFLLAMHSQPGAVFEATEVDVRFERWQDCVRVVRPSGLGQYYWMPHIVKGTWPDGKPKDEIAYVGRLKTGAMGLKTTYGGDIFQGIVQGIAADLMLHAMGKCEEFGFYPVLSVHDEIVVETAATEQSWVDTLCNVLCDTPQWAAGLPVKAEGWQGRRFTK